MNSGPRQRIFWWLKLALGTTVLGTLAWTIHPAALLTAMSRAHIPSVLAACVLLLPNLWFQYKKWAVFVRCIDPSIGPRAIWSSLLLGFAFGIVTPARVGEFGGRLMADARLRSTRALSLVALDKFASMLVTLSAGMIALPLFAVHAGWTGSVVVVPAVAVAVVFPVVVWKMLRRLAKPGTEPEQAKGGIFKRSVARIGESIHLVSDKSAMEAFLYSILFFAAFILQFAMLILAFEDISFLWAVTGAVCVMAAKTVVPPITFGELGIREGFAVYFFSILGMQSASAFNASLLLFTINVLAPSAIGGLLLLRTSFQPRTLP